VKARTAFSSRLSFTLIEMVTAIAVLSLLMILVFSILSSTLKVSDSTSRGADSGSEAKLVLDRIGADISAMVIRPDVDQLYYSGTASSAENDKMFFYSQVTGYFPSDSASAAYYATYQSPATLVGYRINTTDNPSGLPVLERLARGLTVGPDNNPNGVGTSPLQYLTFAARTSATNYPTATGGSITNQWGNDQGQLFPDVGSAAKNYDDGTSSYYDTVGSQVFRFKVCFQLQNGSYSLYPGYTNCAPVYPASITNTVAIVVAIAAIDSKSRKLIPTASWAKMIAALPDPTSQNLATNGLMEGLWNNALNQPTFASTAGIPAIAASYIKVYQRYYYLNVPKAQ